MTFTHETFAQRIRFAPTGAAEAVAAEIEALGAERVMVVTTPRGASQAAAITARTPVAVVHDEARMHVPVEVAERARDVARDRAVDAIVSVGGGSATGLAKAVALTSGLPIVAVPTTYAGSEVTPVWGLTDRSRKTTGTDRRVLPRAVVYDASLLTSLPLEVSVPSGLNALAHSVDALWAPGSNPLNRALATEAVRALADGLPRVVEEPAGLTGHEHTLYGAYVSAVAFASAGSGLHHKICHVLGGAFDLPHAPTHAIVLPHVAALNLPHAPEAERRLSQAFGGPALPSLLALRERLGAPRALRDHGMREEQIPEAVEAVLAVVPAGNPATVTAADLSRVLHAAWAGADPA